MQDFKFQTEQFADIRILRYRVEDFDKLNERQKQLAFHLYMAAQWGRDILWDQNYKYNLLIRNILEHIYTHFKGDKNSSDWKKFEIYLKRIWFSNGIHHHYSTDKILPEFSLEYFNELVQSSELNIKKYSEFNDIPALLEFFKTIVFDENVDAKKVNQAEGQDLVKSSAVNFYNNVSQEEVEEFYNKLKNPENEKLSLGLNSRLSKKDGKIIEEKWMLGGMYSAAIEKICKSLKNALPFAENELQRKSLEKLILYYETGDLKYWDEYNILWVQDTESQIDFINGFIEVYSDPLGRKATYESTLSIKDYEASKRAQCISDNAQWFENHSSTDPKFKKEKVEGISAKAINVIVEAGDCAPSSPIGINLPNADWIRAEYGSKSVSISNIMEAYNEVSKNSGALEEFAYSENEVRMSKKWAVLASNLHVDLHEIVGHGSGKMAEGVGETAETLKNYASTIEEARADLVALYFAINPKLIELGLMPDVEVGYSEYNSYIRGGLMTQLVRIELGKDLEEAHMRNRQLIAKWAFELGKEDRVIEYIQKDEKSYFRINDYEALQKIFGIQLAEIQRIKSEGDFESAKNLVEKYAVKVDRAIHKEVLERWEKLNIKPYSGFINPVIYLTKDLNISIHYPTDFAQHMLYLSENFSS